MVIISVVILALLEMFSNNTHIFSSLNSKKKVNQYASLFISNIEYGLENKTVNMDDLAQEFKLSNELRQELKNMKVQIIYQELSQIDMSEFDEKDMKDKNDKIKKEDVQEITSTEIGSGKNANSSMIFDIGKTVIKTEIASTSFLRIRMQ